MVLSRRHRALVVTAVLLAAAPAVWALGEFSLARPVAIPLPPGSKPTALRAIDVTGDGLVDLVVSSFASPDVRVLVGQGGTTFSTPVVTPMDAGLAFDLGDVNGDGKPDLVEAPDAFFSSGPAILQVHLGDGLGGFPTAGGALDITAGNVVFGLALSDLDEDGDLDAVVEQSAGLCTYFGDGAGGFTGASILTPTPGLAIGHEPFVLDVNGDGHLDFVGSGNAFFFAGWAYLLGDGSGGFRLEHIEYTSADEDLRGSALGDFDGDHRTDFVINGEDLGCPCNEFAFGQGTGSGLVPPEPQSQVTAPSHSLIRAGDLDGDGLGDIVGFENNQLWIVLGHGDFTFGAAQFLPLTELPNWLPDGALSDVDGDGRLDVLAAQFEPPQISILINQTPPSGWTDLGHGLAGSDGIPSLLGQGELQAGAPGSLKLTHANASKLAVLFVAPTAIPSPFKGGTLVPLPVALAISLGTSPAGTITLPWNAWPHLPAGTDFFFQFAIVDSAAPAGASLSNAVRALQP
jgi:hypothetical protein